MNKQDLPKKRAGAGALIWNENGEVLLLEPSYKDNWEIPGGIIEGDESPREACMREIQEEIGLDINVGELLCMEYQREQDDSYMFVFDGGVLSSQQILDIVLQQSEIISFRFCGLEDLKVRVVPKMFERIKKAIEAKNSNTTCYYETIY